MNRDVRHDDVRALRATVATIRSEIHRREKEALDTLRTLLRASRDGQDAVQEVVLDRLDALGYEPVAVRANPRVLSTSGEYAAPSLVDATPRTSVVGRKGGGAAGRSLLLWAHPDGAAFDSDAGGTRDPFAGEVHGGRVYGWGIADDLSGVATALMAASALVWLDMDLTGDLVIASAPSKDHARGVLAVLESGQQVDAAAYLHPAESGRGLAEVKALAPGLLRFRLRVAGRPPETREPNHALYAHLGVDPVETLETVLARLRQLTQRRARTFDNDALRRTLGRTTGMLVNELRTESDSPSRMARAAEATITITSPPGERIDDLRADVQRAVDGVAARNPWLREHPPQIEWLFWTTAVEVAEDDPLYRSVAATLEAVTGSAPRYYPGHAASEIRHPMLNYGIPAVGFGPLAGSFSQAGGVDEWLDVADYLRAIVACATLATHWCGTSDDDFIDIPLGPEDE